MLVTYKNIEKDKKGGSSLEPLNFVEFAEMITMVPGRLFSA